ncbi:hypothetical protein MIND_00511100 [Mycena indigotica]|uniref:Uncharacterized protein n=1 Tax=Mycena indigotica TaxID=2126181 RepID=A0A8H6SVW1_9AGAR|nr:uncharacterized protein MIND_00511100 [Mycena indigotica]KAF7307175.1 hypothetical protein MIND_00511100 [Mycena indigotica]
MSMNLAVQSRGYRYPNKSDKYKYRPNLLNSILKDFRRLANYCTTLHIYLTFNPSLWTVDQQDVQRVLQRLTNLRGVTIRSYFIDSTSQTPKDFNATVIQWLLDHITPVHGKFQLLEYGECGITPALLKRSLATAAARLVLDRVEVFDDVDDKPTKFLPSTSTRPTKLNITKSPHICALLAQSSLATYLEDVSELVQAAITLESQLAPCLLMAPTLQRLHCYFNEEFGPVSSFPTSLPHLRELVFGVPRLSYALPAVVVRLLAHGGLPSLITLKIRLRVAPKSPEKSDRLFRAQNTLYKEFDAALVIHPTLKAVEFSFSSQAQGDDDSEADEDGDERDPRIPRDLEMPVVTHCVTSRLPRTCAKGLLVVDGNDSWDGRYSWFTTA